MNGSGADAFANGFTRGFGLVQNMYERREQKEFRDEQLEMQKEQQKWNRAHQTKVYDSSEGMDS